MKKVKYLLQPIHKIGKHLRKAECSQFFNAREVVGARKHPFYVNLSRRHGFEVTCTLSISGHFWNPGNTLASCRH